MKFKERLAARVLIYKNYQKNKEYSMSRKRISCGAEFEPKFLANTELAMEPSCAAQKYKEKMT